MAEVKTYYNFHKFLLSLLGLWPHNRSKFFLIRKIIFSLITVSSIVPQCLVLRVSDVTPNLVLKILSPITMCLGAIVKYTVFWYQSDVTEGFLDQVEYDWKMNRDEGLKILEQHASLGKHYAKLFAFFIYSSAIGLILLDVSNYILRIVTPKNETFNFPVPMEYLVDEKKYYLPIVVHRCVCVFVVATTFVATESLFIMLLQHCGSLFIVTSEYIVKAVTQDSAYLNGDKRVLINDSKATLLTAIVQQTRAINAYQVATKVRHSCRFARELMERNRGSYSILIILGVLSLSAHLYRLSQSVFDVAELQDTLASLLFATSVMAYMFYLNYMVQQMTDCTANLVPSVYNSNWYETSVTVQKSLLLIMLEGTKEYGFTFFGLYCASIEGFSLLLQKSVSCLMIMTSMQ